MTAPRTSGRRHRWHPCPLRAVRAGRASRGTSEWLQVADHPGVVEAARAYLAGRQVADAVFAVATPVDSDWVHLTNAPWAFSVRATREALGLERLAVINDFAAQALAVPRLAPDERVQIGGGEPQAGAAIAVIGPGTGLGVAGLLPVRRHLVSDPERRRPRLARAPRRAGRGAAGVPAATVRARLERAGAVGAGPDQPRDRARRDRRRDARARRSARGVAPGAERRVPLLPGGAPALLVAARRGSGRSRADLLRARRGLHQRRPVPESRCAVRSRAVSGELRRQGPVRRLPEPDSDLSGDPARPGTAGCGGVSACPAERRAPLGLAGQSVLGLRARAVPARRRRERVPRAAGAPWPRRQPRPPVLLAREPRHRGGARLAEARTGASGRALAGGGRASAARGAPPAQGRAGRSRRPAASRRAGRS